MNEMSGPTKMSPDDPQKIIEILELQPLPDEGGLFRQTYVDDSSTAIYFLVEEGDFSAMHLLDTAEVYHWYGGAPLDLLVLNPDGTGERKVLGPDLLSGQRPQAVVPAGVWQGSSSQGRWSLLGTTMAPGFTWEGFRLGTTNELTEKYPEHAERISELVR